MEIEADLLDGAGPGPAEDSRGPDPDGLRMVEALLFASAEPLSVEELKGRLPEGTAVEELLEDLQRTYSARGVNLVRVAGKWAFRTAEDLAFLMHRDMEEQRKLSRAALETLWEDLRKVAARVGAFGARLARLLRRRPLVAPARTSLRHGGATGPAAIVVEVEEIGFLVVAHNQVEVCDAARESYRHRHELIEARPSG